MEQQNSGQLSDCKKEFCSAILSGIQKSIKLAQNDFNISSARYAAAYDIWCSKCESANEDITEEDFNSDFVAGPEYQTIRKYDRKSDDDLKKLNTLKDLEVYIKSGEYCKLCQDLSIYKSSSNSQLNRQRLSTFLTEAAKEIPSKSLPI